MIKISNGANVLQVTNGAYESIFKRMGYQPVKGAKKAASKKEAVKQQPEQKEASEGAQDAPEEVEELVMGGKPLAQWSKDEVKQFAEEHGIDLAGTKNVTQAKERVQLFLDAHTEEVVNDDE